MVCLHEISSEKEENGGGFLKEWFGHMGSKKKMSQIYFSQFLFLSLIMCFSSFDWLSILIASS